MSAHVNVEEQAVFHRFLSKNRLVGQIAPVYRSNIRTKPVYGLLVSADAVVALYNATCDGMLTREQVYLILRKLRVEPYVQPAKPYRSNPTTSRRVSPFASR